LSCKDGELPHEATGIWQRCEATGQWHTDADIAISVRSGNDAKAPPEALRFLRVLLPNGPSWCVGQYELLPEKRANGMPLWRQRGAERLLFGGKHGSWLIGKSWSDLEADRGAIRLKDHRGMMPQAVAGTWERSLGASKWKADSDISVCEAMSDSDDEDSLPLLTVLLPSGPSECTGSYSRKSAYWLHGMPVWQQVGGSWQIYTDHSGNWMLGNFPDQVQANMGVLEVKDHRGNMPHNVVGKWNKTVEGKWQPCPDALVADGEKSEEPPSLLHVRTQALSTEGCGDYALERGVLIHGMPLWRRTDGDNLLYADSHGNWMIALSSEGANSNVGILSLADHRGLMPHRAGGIWERCSSNGCWQTDPDVTVKQALGTGVNNGQSSLGWCSVRKAEPEVVRQRHSV